jgi:hypothetical protein
LFAAPQVALGWVRRSVRKRAGFDIDAVAPLDTVPQSFIPALFGHGTGDTFIAPAHSRRLLAAYAGDKNLIAFEGDHNSVRPAFFYHSVLIFFLGVLRCEEVPQSGVDADQRPPRADRCGQSQPHLIPLSGGLLAGRMAVVCLSACRSTRPTDRPSS